MKAKTAKTTRPTVKVDIMSEHTGKPVTTVKFEASTWKKIEQHAKSRGETVGELISGLIRAAHDADRVTVTVHASHADEIDRVCSLLEVTREQFLDWELGHLGGCGAASQYESVEELFGMIDCFDYPNDKTRTRVIERVDAMRHQKHVESEAKYPMLETHGKKFGEDFCNRCVAEGITYGDVFDYADFHRSSGGADAPTKRQLAVFAKIDRIKKETDRHPHLVLVKG